MRHTIVIEFPDHLRAGTVEAAVTDALTDLNLWHAGTYLSPKVVEYHREQITQADEPMSHGAQRTLASDSSRADVETFLRTMRPGEDVTFDGDCPVYVQALDATGEPGLIWRYCPIDGRTRVADSIEELMDELFPSFDIHDADEMAQDVD